MLPFASAALDTENNLDIAIGAHYLKGMKNIDEKRTILYKSSPVLPISEKFSAARDVSLVYGDPIEMQGRTIIPIAKVKYSGGAGSGFSFEREDKDPESPGYEELEGGHSEKGLVVRSRSNLSASMM